MGSRKSRFPGALGPWLVGQIELAEGEPWAAALLTHCFTCGKDLKSLVRLSRELARRGIACLRFDFTGIGESEGDFSETSFSSNIGDVLAAAQFMREERLPPAILIGHSLGGTALLAAAAQIPEARLVATIASPSDTAHFRRTLLARAPALADGESGEIVLGGRRFTLRRQLLDDLAEHQLHEAIAGLGRPLLVFQSPDDETLPLSEAERIFALAAQPKSFIALDGADHLMLEREADTRYIAEIVAAWGRRYLLP